MKKETTYKKLILKIILITLTITLSIAFIYAQYMKQDAIERLTKVDAKKTTQLIFESLYSSMERGWDRDDMKKIIKRINKIDENMEVSVFRSKEVSKQFGEFNEDIKTIQENQYIQQALNKNEILNLIDNSTIEYYYPIVAKHECLQCHTMTQAGNVLGVIEITYPVEDLRVSLSSLINFFIIFVITFSIVIFIALFINFDKHLIRPLKSLVKNINTISSQKDISQRITIKNNIQEMDTIQTVFNNMLDNLEHQFYHDELTSLPNRKKLLENVSSKEHAILMIINIDKFQQINDLYGDKIGNEILKNTANIIQEHISPNAILHKLHADEYALYYKSDMAYEDIQEFALHLVTVIENNSFYVKDSEIFINATIGIAYGTKFLLNNADIALKLAKKKKKKFLAYDSSMNIEHEYEQNIKWSRKIKEAIKDDRIVPLFQPIVDTKTKEVVKYEALIRMLDKKGNYISPIHFLELSKKNKLYPLLTKIMLEKTFKTFKELPYQVSINLSVHDILNEMVNKTIMKKLKKYNMGDRVVFEIIESEGIENFDEVSQFIKEVKKYGAKISIDDFGTGYSNFKYLTELNVDYIKIDASIIKDIDINHSSRMVTETIIDFAKKMDIKTVAEFIHSQSVYDVIKEIEIDYAQGYFFGEPQKL